MPFERISKFIKTQGLERPKSVPAPNQPSSPTPAIEKPIPPMPVKPVDEEAIQKTLSTPPGSPTDRVDMKKYGI